MKKRTSQTMNRFRMRAIAFVIVFAMALSPSASMPMDVFAASAYQGKCGDNLTWEYDSDYQHLSISGDGDMWDWTEESLPPWNKHRFYIKSVQFNGNITSIGDLAFVWCHSVSSINIPNGVTKIGHLAFYDCESLVYVRIPNTVISVGQQSFAHCKALSSITLPDSITSLGSSAFSECNNLSSIVISKSLSEIGNYTFKNCKNLTEVVIPNGVTNIGKSAFSGCSSLASINIPNHITVISESVFSGCSSLETVKIPNSVTTIEKAAFYGCESITTINIPDKIGIIEQSVFENCKNLKSITIPNSVNKICNSAFYQCSSLNNISIPNSITSIESMAFAYCSSLTKMDLPKNITTIEIATFSHSGLESVSIPNSVTKIEKGAFLLCSNLKSVFIPDSVKEVGSLVFASCSDLSTISIPKHPFTRNFGNTFLSCDKIKDVYYRGTVTDWENYRYSYTGDIEKECSSAVIHFLDDDSENEDPNLTSISVKTLPNKTTYYYDLDKEVDTTGLALTATYKDGTTKEIIDGFTCQPFLFGSETGKQTVTVTYEGKKTSFDVNIIPVKSLELKKKPNKLTYEKGENVDSTGLISIDTTGMILLATYEDGVQKEVTKNFECVPSSITNDAFVVRGHEVTIKFGGKTVKYRIAFNGTVQAYYRSDGEIAKNSDGTYQDIPHKFYYSDRFFYYDNTTYHNDLAVMSLGMELASYSSHITDDQYLRIYNLEDTEEGKYCERAKNIKKLYFDLDFENVKYYNYELALGHKKDKAAYSFASKPIIDEKGDVDTLVTVVVRGGGYGAEWASNFNVGNSGNHVGFQTPANEIYQSLVKYLASIKDSSEGEFKLWITGFSRGAAIANLTAHMINANQLVKPENVYAYTFATPKGYYGSSNLSADNNIFNIISSNDLIPKLACKQWGFSTYGQNVILPNYTPDVVKNGFKTLTGVDFEVGNNYTIENNIINSLVKIAPDRNTFYNKCQENVVEQFYKNYFYNDKGALKIPGSLIEGIHNSDVENKLSGFGFMVDGIDFEIDNYDSFIGTGIILGTITVNAMKLMTVGNCHYPEHYLSWLETGGEYTISSASQYSGLSEERKKQIETAIKAKFEESYQLHCVSCPVDVKVYDSSNNLVVSIVNNEVEVDELPCYVEGETKYFYTYGDDFRVELTGNGTGTMDYQVQEFNNESEMVRTVNHYDLALTEGKQYTGQIKNTILDKTNTYALTTNSNTVKPAYDSMTPVGSKHKVTIVNGASLTEFAYQNECVEILAEEKEGKYFSHWISDAGDGIFNDANSQATNFVMPNKDVKITAVYVDSTILGDLNNDGIVNAKDNAILAAAFGKRKGNSGYNEAADFNNDGIINAKDKAIISQNFGKRK